MAGSCWEAISSTIAEFGCEFWVDFNQVALKAVQFVGNRRTPGSVTGLNDAVLKGSWRVLKQKS